MKEKEKEKRERPWKNNAITEKVNKQKARKAKQIK